METRLVCISPSNPLAELRQQEIHAIRTWCRRISHELHPRGSVLRDNLVQSVGCEKDVTQFRGRSTPEQVKVAVMHGYWILAWAHSPSEGTRKVDSMLILKRLN